MPSLAKTKALVLRATKYGEADLIISVLTVEGEKLSLLARGALKSKKRFGGGVLEPTHYVDLSYRKAQSEKKLGSLEEASLVSGFEKIRESYEKLETALLVVDCLSRVSQEGDVHSVGLFNLGGHSLRSLEAARDLTCYRLHFFLKLLSQQGVLEVEAWMNPYLAIPMAEHGRVELYEDPQKELHLIWAENKLREYLATGILFNQG